MDDNRHVPQLNRSKQCATVGLDQVKTNQQKLNLGQKLCGNHTSRRNCSISFYWQRPGMMIRRSTLRRVIIPKQPKGPVARRHPCRREPSPSAAIAMSARGNVSISASGRCGRNGGGFLCTHVIEEQSEPAGGTFVAVGIRWGRFPPAQMPMGNRPH